MRRNAALTLLIASLLVGGCATPTPTVAPLTRAELDTLQQQAEERIGFTGPAQPLTWSGVVATEALKPKTVALDAGVYDIALTCGGFGEVSVEWELSPGAAPPDQPSVLFPAQCTEAAVVASGLSVDNPGTLSVSVRGNGDAELVGAAFALMVSWGRAEQAVQYLGANGPTGTGSAVLDGVGPLPVTLFNGGRGVNRVRFACVGVATLAISIDGGDHGDLVCDPAGNELDLEVTLTEPGTVEASVVATPPGYVAVAFQLWPPGTY